ncbi:hypothetical protein [Litoreibacter roseus]|uniref:Uncharacterized protein n=1 Tax=Litoreibacter roseus TaxID=2601869 RepID=A0A6N6JJ57_9RHOB|nr:hypothetical protein [Litoreibacter roseus]GFE65232.1 hypothetical protein KIN_23060 [Litoreibacter roseus]
MRYLVLFLILTVSVEAQTVQTPKQDAEELMTASIEFAEQLLQNYGEFFPFGAAMKPDGQMILVAGYDGDERPPSHEIIDLLNAGFRSSAVGGDYKATALTYDVRVSLPGTSRKSDAVAIALDHEGDYSVVVYWPYKLSRGEVSFGEVFAEEGVYGIFPEP